MGSIIQKEAKHKVSWASWSSTEQGIFTESWHAAPGPEDAPPSQTHIPRRPHLIISLQLHSWDQGLSWEGQNKTPILPLVLGAHVCDSGSWSLGSCETLKRWSQSNLHVSFLWSQEIIHRICLFLAGCTHFSSEPAETPQKPLPRVHLSDLAWWPCARLGAVDFDLIAVSETTVQLVKHKHRAWGHRPWFEWA